MCLTDLTIPQGPRNKSVLRRLAKECCNRHSVHPGVSHFPWLCIATKHLVIVCMNQVPVLSSVQAQVIYSCEGENRTRQGEVMEITAQWPPELRVSPSIHLFPPWIPIGTRGEQADINRPPPPTLHFSS